MKQHYVFLIFLCSASFLIFLGCKDTELTTTASQEEKCAQQIDKGQWDDAITTCEAIKTDKGWRLAANAYMGRAGLNMLTLASNLSSTSGDTTAQIIAYLPSDTQEKSDYNSAVDILMTKVVTRNSSDWLEVLLITTLLIFEQFTTATEFGLAADSSGNTISCVDDLSCTTMPLSDATYNALCDNVAGQVNNINSCTVQTGSLLDYNNQASNNLTDLGDFSQLNLYTKMNNGLATYNDSGAGGGDCTMDAISGSSTDIIIDDCEIFGYFTDSSNF